METPASIQPPSSQLPPDFSKELNRLSKMGWHTMSANELKIQAEDAISEVLEEQDQRTQKDMASLNLSGVSKVFTKIERALHARLCAEGKLRPDLRPLMMGEIGAENIERIAEIVSLVAVAVHPSFNVSRVIIYLAFWVSKVGLDSWCALPRAQV